MFVHSQTVQLHHTDAYGIIFFANQFKFCHNAFQAFLEHVGLPLPPTRQQVASMLVIVHAESDYKAPMQVGDRLRVEVRVETIGTTSLIMRFTLTNQHGVLVGTTKTVHVCIDTATSGKVPLPETMRLAFTAHVG